MAGGGFAALEEGRSLAKALLAGQWGEEERERFLRHVKKLFADKLKEIALN